MIKELIAKLVSYLRSIFSPANIYTNTDTTYRERVQKIVDYYNGEQLHHLSRVLDTQFSKPQSLKMQLSISNIVRFIADTLCLSFKNGIKITTVNPQDQEIINKIIADTSLNSFLRTLEQIVFLCKTAFVKVGWSNGTISLDIITPQYVNVSVDDDNPLKVTEVVYPKEITNKNIYAPEGTFHYWSDTEYKVVNQNGDELAIPENDSNVNPYGIIPIMPFYDKVITDGYVIQWPGDELINAQESLNIKLTSLNQLIKYQSFSQPVLVNPTKDLNGHVGIEVDPSKPIVVFDDKDSKGDFKFVSPDAKIESVQNAIDKEYLRIFSFYGINPSQFVSSAERMSGTAFKESQSHINEYREMVRVLYAPQLQKLLKIIETVYNSHSISKLSGEGYNINIYNASVNYNSVDDVIKEREFKLKYNLANISEFIIEDTDDTDEEGAIKQIERNRILNKQLIEDSSSNDNNTTDKPINGTEPDTNVNGDNTNE